jgi:ABC-2 type transport system ATP-binding protein
MDHHVIEDSVELSRATAHRGGRVAFDRLSLHIGPGVTLLDGPSLEGSAVLEALAGVLPLTAGRRVVNGRPTTTVDDRRRITLVPGRPWEAGHLDASRALHMVAVLWDVRDPRGAIAREVARWSLAPILKRRMGHLSGGEMRRVLLAASLLPDPAIWLVDGGDQALDAEGRAVWAALLTRVHFGLPGAPRVAVVAGGMDPRLANTRLRL